MTNDGRIVYGNYDGGTEVIESSKAYNDGTWHSVIGTQGPNGMTLYIDGQLIGTQGATTAQSYTGYWRLGGDNLNGWPDQPSSENFSGQLDEFAVYPTALTANQASTHYALAQGATAPTSQFTYAVTNQSVAFDGTGSSAPNGQPVTYSWNFGDGSAASTSSTPTHTYTAGGTYPVSLTVTSSSGLTATSTQNVVVAAPHTPPVANIVSSTSGLTGTFDGTGSTASDGATITGYQWSFGDGATSSSAKPSHLYASAGTYPVTLVVTDSKGATSTSATTSVTVTHAAPTASFSTGGSGLKVTVDASATTASDGATLSYDWNWGDGSTHGSGVTASHTYTSAGSNTVTLTVTDSDGATATTTHSVSPSHAAPVASFAATATGLNLSVDGTGSSASDGASLTYDWGWGDGTSHGSGATATHSYASAGTYTVTLIVTDSLGATSTVTKSVTATSVAYVAKDTFNRTLPSTWGTADVGGTWSTATGLSVSGGVGKINGTAGSTRATYLSGTNAKDIDIRAQLAESVVPSTGTAHFNLVARHTSAGDYHLKVRITSPGTVTVNVCKTVGTTETLLGSTKVLTGYTYTSGALLDLRFNLVTSGSSTTLNGKVWPDGTTEPSAWTVTSTDSESALQVPGQIGVTTYVTSSVPNGPVVFSVGSLTAQ